MANNNLFTLMSNEELSSIQESLLSFIEKGEGSKLPKKKTLVLGDVGLDRYVFGSVERISPEAPVPITLVSSREEKLGLSANVAQNFSSLNSPCDLVSILGEDEAASSFKKLVSDCDFIKPTFFISTKRPTTVKTRIISGQHHLLRLDDEDKKPLSNDEWDGVRTLLDQLDWASYSSIILQDYGKGFLTKELCQYVISKAKENGVISLVDPSQTASLLKYKGADFFKPNQKEVAVYKDSIEQDYKSLLKSIKEKGEFKSIINTMGSEGMCLFSDELEVRVPTFAKKVFDVTGAGDTVIASLAFALSQGLNLKEASVFSNLCAGHVVTKVGAVSIKFSDILKALKSLL